MSPKNNKRDASYNQLEASQGRFERIEKLVPLLEKTTANFNRSEFQPRAQQCEKGGFAGSNGARPVPFMRTIGRIS